MEGKLKEVFEFDRNAEEKRDYRCKVKHTFDSEKGEFKEIAKFCPKMHFYSLNRQTIVIALFLAKILKNV